MEDEMNSNKSHIYFLFTILIFGILLSGCDFSSKIKINEVRLGMFGENKSSSMNYSYGTFTGVENGQVQAENGQAIAFSYEVSMRKGGLLIEWQDPEGKVAWQESFESDAEGAIEIPVETAGTYTIIIKGKKSGGSFQVAWEID
jgi:hypothetical protein